MKIKITHDKEVRGSNTGIDLVVMKPKEVHDVSESLAKSLTNAGLAEYVEAKSVEKAPENKAIEEAPENKSNSKKKTTRKKKS